MATLDNDPVDAAEININFPVVGIGASAGGLEAITALLRHLPTDTGMAFVFVQHLAPAHESMLTELLARETNMPVHEITDGMAIKPNHLRQQLEDTISQQTNFNDFIVEHKFADIGERRVKISGRFLAYGLKLEPMVLMQIEDISQKHTE